MNKAILDTSALISLYELDLLQTINLLYNEVRIPRAVTKEFLQNPKSTELEKTRRFNYYHEAINKNDSWLKECTEYGIDLIRLYESFEGMDKGEAEALAQNQSLDCEYEVIIDEKTAKRLAKNQNMVVIPNSLFRYKI